MSKMCKIERMLPHGKNLEDEQEGKDEKTSMISKINKQIKMTWMGKKSTMCTMQKQLDEQENRTQSAK